MILFAGFFIESNLNYIVEEINMKQNMTKFLNMKYPGIQDKLGYQLTTLMQATQKAARLISPVRFCKLIG